MAGLEKIPVHPIHGKRLAAAVHEALLDDATLHKPEAFPFTFRYTSPNLSVREEIGDNQVPTLLVCGGRERRFAPIRDFVAASLPAVRVVDADAGHAVNIQAADTFNEAVSAFISDYCE